MALTAADRLAALRDPAFHRYLMFGAADAVLASRLGRELRTGEAQGRLPWPQLEIVRRVERAIAERSGEVITVRMARQTGKNETEGFIECRALAVFRGIPGSVYIRCAPTWKPQIVNSKLRLEKFTKADPLVRGKVRNREGYIVECGGAQVHFLSAGPTANVVGATASIALSVDEAHKIDRGKFEEDLGPFTASTNAPTVMWGVAADKLDMLHEYHERNRGTDRFLEYPADVWCELSSAYAAHYAGRVAALGKDHPVILTQYDLVDVESAGGYLNAAQRAALFSGDHPRLTAPRDGMAYALLVDIGGESEQEGDDEALRGDDPGRDYTWVHVVEWDLRAPVLPYPEARIVEAFWWTGRQHMAVAPELVRIARAWRVSSGVIDARGVGEAVAMEVSRAVPCVEPYKASAPDVSADCYDLLARLNTGRVRFWKADPAADPEYREMAAETRHTRYEIRGHDLMRLTKPRGTGAAGLHIDALKALTYLHRALGGPGAGGGTEDVPENRGRLNPFEGRRGRLA